MQEVFTYDHILHLSLTFLRAFRAGNAHREAKLAFEEAQAVPMPVHAVPNTYICGTVKALQSAWPLSRQELTALARALSQNNRS